MTAAHSEDPGLAGDDDVHAAFASGTLRLVIDDESKFDSRRTGMFRGCNRWKDGEPIRIVHVVSKSAGGEIRGYVIVRQELYERGPSYMRWPAMDREVSRQIAFPIGVAS